MSDTLHTRNQPQRHSVTVGDLRRAKLARMAARERYEREQREGWHNFEHYAAERYLKQQLEEEMDRIAFRSMMIFVVCIAFILIGIVLIWSLP